MLERDVKKEVKKLLEKYGAWYAMTVPTGYGKKGIPDFLCCCNGGFIAIETKVHGRKPTPHQEREIMLIKAAKGWALVVDETNLEALETLLKRVRTQ